MLMESEKTQGNGWQKNFFTQQRKNWWATSYISLYGISYGTQFVENGMNRDNQFNWGYVSQKVAFIQLIWDHIQECCKIIQPKHFYKLTREKILKISITEICGGWKIKIILTKSKQMWNIAGMWENGREWQILF